MIAIITGAGKGIGLAIADLFIKNGYTVLTCGRNDTTLSAAAASYPTGCFLYKVADLSVAADASAFTTWCLEKGVPDVLVNNAGYFLPGSSFEDEPGTLERMMSANLYSAYYVTRGLLPAMIEKKQGHVFNMCSIAALKAYKGGGSYSISKFALRGFTENLRFDLMQYGIKVTGIYPGAVMTDSWAGFDNSTQRIMEPGDIARMIYYATQLSAAACIEDIIIRPQLGDL